MNGCFLRIVEHKKIAKGSRIGNLFIINCKKISKVDIVVFIEYLSIIDNVDILHENLGHLHVKRMNELQYMVSQLDLGRFIINLACDGAFQGCQEWVFCYV